VLHIGIAKEITADIRDEPHHLGHLQPRRPIGVSEHGDVLERMEVMHFQMPRNEIGVGDVTFDLT
jgi:hypothetical protein